MLDSPMLPYWAGAFRRPDGPATFAVQDPSTGLELGRLPFCGAQEAHEAVTAAVGALQPVSLAERERWLRGIAAALLAHQERLATVITAENGKPMGESRGEVAYAAGFFTDAASHLDRLAPHHDPRPLRGQRWEVHHLPAGVAALITPWNFPLGMLAKKMAGALAAGCPVVAKPAELTPFTTVVLFALLHELGLPPGQVNLVFGDAPAIGRVLCERPEVRVVSFTGSTRVGRVLAQQCAPNLKRLSMELGGNAPFVVFADADLDHAVDQLMANKFRCGGQTCVCSNRVLVAAEVADAFTTRVASRVRELVVGPGYRDGVDVGPLIGRDGWNKVQAHVADALDHGAEAVVGGLADEPGGACFFPPTVLKGVRPGMACTLDETFGPVVAIGTFEDEDEAVRLANDTPYGLAAYLFSGDRARLERIALRLHFGHVGLNSAVGPTPELPFGGMGQSGYGREGGLEGVMEFVELQTRPIGPG